mmetsp:Transcript_9984/g.26179  ORF Transcript_9984/g.26179 Transcript_9984/m.26179 type:complete len:336 (+) Transcript_9984:62-1069(+)
MYCFAGNQTALITSRIIVGFGSATMSVCRAHVTRAVPKSIRTAHFAYLSALQFIGFAVLPAFGGVLAMIPEFEVGPAVFNDYSYPGYTLVVSNIVAIALLLLFYSNPPRTAPAHTTATPASTLISKPADPEKGEAAPAAPSAGLAEQADKLALTACLFINICFRGSVAQLETVTSPFLLSRYDKSLESASFIIGTIGFFGLIVYLVFGMVSAKIPDRISVVAGLACLVAGSAVLAAPVTVPLLTYEVALAAIWSLAYPLGQTAILALFSKKLAGLPAGGFLGLFSMCGSLARLVFAIVAGQSWSSFGESSVFQGMLLYSSITLIFSLFVFKRLAV